MINNSLFEQSSMSYIVGSVYSSPFDDTDFNVKYENEDENEKEIRKFENNWISRPWNYGPEKELLRGILFSPNLNGCNGID